MHALSLRTLESSGLYQALLSEVVAKSMGDDGVGAEPLIPFIHRMVEERDHEASTETEKRWFREFSILMDKLGAAKVLKALADCMENLQDRDLYAQVQQVLRDVCMRHETVRDGRRYDAHLMMVPLIFRGGRAAQFPSVIDSEVAGHLQIALQKAFEGAVPHGEDVLIVPGNVLYTLDEFRDERLDFFHGLLSMVTQICRDTPNVDRPRWMKFPNALDHGVLDSTLIDLSIPPLVGKESSPARAANPSIDLVKNLPDGLWVTAKMLPVVVLWPRENDDGQRSAPSLESLGDVADELSRWISFCAPSKSITSGEGLDFEVRALGLFSPFIASLRARMVITHETFMGSLLKSLPALDKDGLFVRFKYSVENSLFDVEIFANNGNGGVQVHLPQSSTTQLYIEKMADEVRALGIQVEIDLGDGMLRYEGVLKSSLQ